MWELDCEESWAPKNWCFWTVVLEKTLESPLDCKEIQLVRPKGDQSWVFIGRTDAEAETPILWPPHTKSWLIGKDPDTGRDWGQEEKGMTEDEMTGWHHRLDAHEFGWTLGVGDGQGGLVCCDSWGRKESDTTKRLNWTELNVYFSLLTVTNHVWYAWYHLYYICCDIRNLGELKAALISAFFLQIFCLLFINALAFLIWLSEVVTYFVDWFFFKTKENKYSYFFLLQNARE